MTFPDGGGRVGARSVLISQAGVALAVGGIAMFQHFFDAKPDPAIRIGETAWVIH